MMVNAPVQTIQMQAEDSRHVKYAVTPFQVETLFLTFSWTKDNIFQWCFKDTVAFGACYSTSECRHTGGLYDAGGFKCHCQELQYSQYYRSCNSQYQSLTGPPNFLLLFLSLYQMDIGHRSVVGEIPNIFVVMTDHQRDINKYILYIYTIFLSDLYFTRPPCRFFMPQHGQQCISILFWNAIDLIL